MTPLTPEQVRQWAGRAMAMATSATEAWDRGYLQAVGKLFDSEMAKAENREQQIAAKKQRQDREFAAKYEDHYQGVRASLDAAPDSFYMSRPTAQFYLGMSPQTFKRALERGPHPFGAEKAGATKGEVDAWFQRLVAAKHAKKLPNARPVRVSRDTKSGRPYLVDESGTILADGIVSNIHADDAAYALGRGAGITILSLDDALARPWRDRTERTAWARWRERVLTAELEALQDRLRRAKAQDLDAVYGEAGEGGGGRL